MSIRIRRFIPPAILTIAIFGMPALAGAQQKEGALSGNIKYNTGQSVQPIFEGWTRLTDGSYQLFFGYLNRNHVEEVPVPVGADNRSNREDRIEVSPRTSTLASTASCSPSRCLATSARRK